MSETQATVAELEEYWDYLPTVQPGQWIDRYIETHRMPPWEDICFELSWQTYPLIKGGPFKRKHHGYRGVYRLVALLADNDTRNRATITRLGGEDRSGTLYIGKADFLDLRLNQLRRSLGFESSHGASSIWKQSTILGERFPPTKLGVATLSTKANIALSVEKDLVRAYLNSFGDTPPLNCSF